MWPLTLMLVYVVVLKLFQDIFDKIKDANIAVASKTSLLSLLNTNMINICFLNTAKKGIVKQSL